MEYSLRAEPTSPAATEDIPRLLCLVHKSPPLVHILSKINLVHTVPHYFLRSILILFSLLRLGLAGSLLSLRFITNI
jgi:hypothetical protein